MIILADRKELPELKLKFAKALVNSLNESKALRNLLKEKALEMFNDDYELFTN